MPAGEPSQASSSIWYQCSDLSQYFSVFCSICCVALERIEIIGDMRTKPSGQLHVQSQQ